MVDFINSTYHPRLVARFDATPSAICVAPQRLVGLSPYLLLLLLLLLLRLFARQAAVNLNVFDTDIGNDQHIHTVEGGKGKSRVGTSADCCVCLFVCLRVGGIGAG